MGLSAVVNMNKIYITERLQRDLPAILEKPITIIEAPMGYGKTAVVKEFLKGQQVDAVWIPLSGCLKGDYWELFCRKLEEQYPDESEMAARLLSLGFPKRPEEIYQVLDILRSHVFDRETIMIADDYHLVNNDEMSSLIEIMVQHSVDRLHMVLITRDTYCGNSEVLSLKGYLKRIDRSCFEFSTCDIQAYYEKCGVIVTEEEAVTLGEVTEGWVSALFLYLLRYEKEGVMAFPTNIYELIDKELFSGYTQEMKDLLFALTPFREFNYSQAEFVWGSDHLHDLLTGFRFKNAFLFYDDHSKQFHIHRVLLKFLEQNMERLPAERRSAYYIRCGECYEEEHNHDGAIACYYRAGDYKNILGALEKSCRAGISPGRWPFYARLLRECPETELKEHLWTVFLMIITAHMVNDVSSCEWLRTFFLDCLSSGRDNQVPQGRLEGALELLYAFECYNDIEEMKKHYDRGCLLLEESGACLSVESQNWTYGSFSILCMFHRKGKTVTDEIRRMKEGALVHTSLMRGYGMGSAQMMEAEYFLNQGEFEQAEVAAFAAEAVAKKYHQESIISCGWLIRQRCALFKGDMEAFTRIREMIGNHDRPEVLQSRFLSDQLELSHAFICATVGQIRLISQWIRQEDVYKQRLYYYGYPVYQIVFGRYLLSKGAYSRVIGLFKILIQDPLYAHHALFLIYGYLYIAVAQDRLKWRDQALETLREALALALPDRLYLPVAENYDELKPLFDLLGPAEQEKRAVGEIEALAARLCAGTEKIFGRRPETEGRLSDREKELVRQACTSKTYGEIAEELFLAKSTVKRSMVVIFRKLGIHGRQELLNYMDEE